MDYTDMGYMPRSLPRSLASTPGRRSAFGDSVHSLASEGNSVSMSRAAGNARSFSQRSSRSHALDIATAEREMLWDSNMHIVPREQPWNNHDVYCDMTNDGGGWMLIMAVCYVVNVPGMANLSLHTRYQHDQ